MESIVIYTLILVKPIQYFCQKQLTTHNSQLIAQTLIAHRLLPNVFGVLAVLAGVFCGGIADGDESHGLVAFGELEQALELGDVEVAHPTGGKALLGGGKAEVLNGDGDVYVGMVVGVVSACPCLGLVLAAEDDGGHVVDPIAVVAGFYGLEAGLVRNPIEEPWLAVYGAGRKPNAFLYVPLLFCLNFTLFKCSAAAACLA